MNEIADDLGPEWLDLTDSEWGVVVDVWPTDCHCQASVLPDMRNGHYIRSPHSDIDAMTLWNYACRYQPVTNPLQAQQRTVELRRLIQLPFPELEAEIAVWKLRS